MANKAEILTGLRRTHSRDLDVLVNSAATLSDDNTLTGLTDMPAGGFKSGDAKVLAAGAGQLLTQADSGKTVVFGAAAATLIKLPAPELGMVFNFISAITATGDHEIQALTNDHGFLGGCTIMNTTADQTNAFSAATDGNNDFITMNGSTTGGIAGSAWRIVAILDASAAKCWAAHGNLIGSGNTTTPFADA